MAKLVEIDRLDEMSGEIRITIIPAATTKPGTDPFSHDSKLLAPTASPIKIATRSTHAEAVLAEGKSGAAAEGESAGTGNGMAEGINRPVSYADVYAAQRVRGRRARFRDSATCRGSVASNPRRGSRAGGPSLVVRPAIQGTRGRRRRRGWRCGNRHGRRRGG